MLCAYYGEALLCSFAEYVNILNAHQQNYVTDLMLVLMFETSNLLLALASYDGVWVERVVGD